MQVGAILLLVLLHFQWRSHAASIFGGANIHISCFASLISFEIHCSYGLWTQIYEHSPLQLSTLATPLSTLLAVLFLRLLKQFVLKPNLNTTDVFEVS